jgi:hypothetical protein
MSLEDKLDQNTLAVKELTTALLGKKPATTGGVPAATATPPKAAATTVRKSNATLEIVTNAVVRVREEMGEAEAKRIIREVGGAEKLKDIPSPKWDAVIAAAEAALAAAASAPPVEDDDL